jgi:pimeloyl-ACP methyl ester carboxylesterase
MELHVERWGDRGAPALLVHGSVTNGEMTWGQQRPLAKDYRLRVMDRRGYYPNPPIDREDFEVDADDVAGLLDSCGAGGMHLVGHSYGGVIALLAAAKRPEAVRSLTVIEPPAFRVAIDDPRVREFVDGVADYWTNGPRDPEAFLRGFLEFAGSSANLPTPLPPPVLQAARLLMVERSAAEAVLPLGDLRGAPFPKLVVSGAHSAIFDRVCDVLEQALAAERAVIPGAGHSVPRTGVSFNSRLVEFIESAESSRMRDVALA